jgi:hypothetical protein
MKTRTRTLRLLFVLVTVLAATAPSLRPSPRKAMPPMLSRPSAAGAMYAKFGAAIGAGMVVIGAGLGIGRSPPPPRTASRASRRPPRRSRARSSFPCSSSKASRSSRS